MPVEMAATSTAAAPRPPARRFTGNAPPAMAGRTAAGHPLLAVCGVCSGAGASTLGRLIAQAAAHAQRGEVAFGHVTRPAEAPAVVPLRHLLAGLLLGPPERPARLRDVPGLHAADPSARAGEPERAAPVRGALARARAEHALTVLDCGRLRRPAERLALASASHVAWVLPATASGLACARRALQRTPPAAHAAELVIARHVPTGAPARLDALRALAGERPASLVLAPRLAPWVAARDAAALEAAQVALQAILGALSR
jgi:hypothetical protein